MSGKFRALFGLFSENIIPVPLGKMMDGSELLNSNYQVTEEHSH